MVKVESATEEVINALATHLESGIKGLHTMSGFPEANARLKYPMIAISNKFMNLTNVCPYEHKIGDIEDHQALVEYVVGEYDFEIQLDIFERTKEERDDLYQKFFDAFNSNFPAPGLKLVLDKYYSVVCSFQITRYEPNMNENRSKTKEWRSLVDISGNCKAIRCKEMPIITQEPQVELEADPTIVE